jgi:hypothetical protein
MLKTAIARRLTTCLATLGLVGAASLALAAPASAGGSTTTSAGGTNPAAVVTPMSASGCTLAPNGYVCGKVDGSGLHVSAAHVARGKSGTEFICDYQGTVRVYNSAGRRIYLKRSGRHQGCTPLRAWFDFSVNRTFPNNSKLCTSFYERGIRQGTTCFKIHR